MKSLIFSIVVGILGTLPFLFGAASSSGGNYVVLALPAKLLQYATFNWGLQLNDVQLNRWAVVAQFVGYFLLALLVITIINMLAKKHNKSFNPDGANNAPPG